MAALLMLLRVAIVLATSTSATSTDTAAPEAEAAFSVGSVSTSCDLDEGRVRPTDEQILEAIYLDTKSIEHDSVNNRPPQPTKSRACFDELGCFDAYSGVFSYIGDLPESPDYIDATFTLYTRANQNKGVRFTYRDVSQAVLLLRDLSGLVTFVTHGFSSSASEPWLLELKDAALNRDGGAVILLDWSNGCSFPWYRQAVVNSELVGRETAVVLWKLMQAVPETVKPESVHFIGHSLGAHVGRFFADYFFDISSGIQFGRITGLDPAGPLLEAHNVYVNSSSASFVDILHTAAGTSSFLSIMEGKVGMSRAVGHLDLFINGGSVQPGCPIFQLTCAHSRSYSYYIWASRIASSSMHSNSGSVYSASWPRPNKCSFPAYACKGGLDEYLAGHCHRVPGQWNEISLDESSMLPGRGMEFVDTTGKEPFCVARP